MSIYIMTSETQELRKNNELKKLAKNDTYVLSQL